MVSSKNFEKKQLTKKSKNIPRWYTDVIQMAGLADYGPARGTMVIRPYGYAIWEFVQKEFDKEIQKQGVENAYFPLFIPMSLLQKEKDHIKGFAPELAVVTHGGGKKLAEPLAIRPTSETIMYEMYAKWISSWRDLPLKINQWNNVVRWEKRTYFFLRTLEFLWQEGHTAHATYDEAEEMTLSALETYERIYKEVFAIPGLTGIKSEAEKFAGADHTYAIEVLMPGGKALQAATSHNLGQNFSKVIGISFQDKGGKNQHVWQTSWGLSTRSLGALFLVHGDDQGLVLPPKLAPLRAVIIPVLGKKDEEILKYCQRLKEEIDKSKSKFPGRIKVFGDKEKSYGWRVNEAEIKGVPLRILIGTQELNNRTATISFRLEGFDDKLVRFKDVAKEMEKMFVDIQDKMYKKADKYLQKNIRRAKDYKEFKQMMKSDKGFIQAFWCEGANCETKIKTETKATTRFKSLDAKKQNGTCIYCGKKAKYIWHFGQAY